MRIGIFTFHDEYNYGSALQAYALQEYLVSKGYDVAVLHHHISAKDARIRGIFANRSLRGWIRFLVLGICGGGQFARQLRLWKSSRFVAKYLRLTKYRFYFWRDAPSSLGVDALVVGSDQLWSCQWESPAKYLLEGAPSMPAIAYAVSIGVSTIPASLHQLYNAGFSRFSRISVREHCAIGLMRECGYRGEVAQTVDPTLLTDASTWKKLLRGVDQRVGRYLFCYLMGEDIESVLPSLATYAKTNNCAVKIVVESFYWNNSTLKPMRFVKSFIHGVKLRSYCRRNNIRVLLNAAHKDFLECIYGADKVITDSFHALMFSINFKKDIRIVRPHGDYRGKMFSRIEDACKKYIKNDVICTTVESALLSFNNRRTEVNKESLMEDVKFSREWLSSAINQVSIKLECNR